jgi:hypothetical protein
MEGYGTTKLHTYHKLSPVPWSGDSKIAAVYTAGYVNKASATSYVHKGTPPRTSYILTEAGEVFAAGAGVRGELGDGTLASARTNFVKIEGLPPVKRLSAHAGHCVAQCTDGKFYGWGKNSDKEFVTKGAHNILTPTELDLSFLVGTPPVKVDAVGYGIAVYHNEYQASVITHGNTVNQIRVYADKPINNIVVVPGVAKTGSRAVASFSDGSISVYGGNPYKQKEYDIAIPGLPEGNALGLVEHNSVGGIHPEILVHDKKGNVYNIAAKTGSVNIDKTHNFVKQIKGGSLLDYPAAFVGNAVC